MTFNWMVGSSRLCLPGWGTAAGIEKPTGCSRQHRCHPERSRVVWPRIRAVYRSQPDVSTEPVPSRVEVRYDFFTGPIALPAMPCYDLRCERRRPVQRQFGVCRPYTAYVKAETAYYLEARPESGFIWRLYKQQFGGESRQTMRCPVARVNE